MFQELTTVVVRTLSTATRDIAGTKGVCRQPAVGDVGTVVGLVGPSTCSVECVDTSGRTLWLADFKSDELSEFPQGWTFNVQEVTPCVYEATGHGPRGESVASTDTDADKALSDCRAFALRQWLP